MASDSFETQNYSGSLLRCPLSKCGREGFEIMRVVRFCDIGNDVWLPMLKKYEEARAVIW